jgi:hypothetical protein
MNGPMKKQMTKYRQVYGKKEIWLYVSHHKIHLHLPISHKPQNHPCSNERLHLLNMPYLNLQLAGEGKEA